MSLKKNGEAYYKWKNYYWPNLLTVLNQFPNVQPDAAVLCSLLPILQPRLYSVSSSPKVAKDEIHLTISVVAFQTPDGTHHKGVTSSYINCVELGSTFHCFLRRYRIVGCIFTVVNRTAILLSLNYLVHLHSVFLRRKKSH